MQMSKAHHKVHQAEANQKSQFVQVVGLLQIHRVAETPELHRFSIPEVGSHLHEVVHQKQGDVSQVYDQTTCKDGCSRCRFWIVIVGVLQEGLRAHLGRWGSHQSLGGQNVFKGLSFRCFTSLWKVLKATTFPAVK